MTARTDAQDQHERRPATALELDLDYCSNTIGVSPCTANRMDSGTAQAGAVGSITLRAGASAADDEYNGMTVHIVSGAGAGQERKISDYVGATKVATVTVNFSPAPDNTSVYNVIDRANGCYQVFLGDSPCKDKDNFVKGVKTIKFIDRGVAVPGEQVRPYIVNSDLTATEIDPVKSLAARSQVTFKLADEPARDDLDKYIDDRVAPAGGTYLTRLIARNPNAIGRFARARRGYVMSPWDWATFQTELYVIEVLKGPDKNGQVTLTLSDAVKLLDRVMLPAATGGKLQEKLFNTVNTGFMQSGSTSTTAVLAAAASSTDDAYNGMELHITGGLGFGQRRVITDYVGSTRTATVAAWDTTPDNTSIYEVTQLNINVGSGKGAEYTDPSVSGRAEFVCIGDEVIRYTVLAGDVLSWPDSSYREQYGTTRTEHDAGAGVQQCLAYDEDEATYVVNDLLNRGNISDTYIDTAKLASLEAQWYGPKAYITACITHPEKGNELMADLLTDLNMMSWWHPVDQKVQFETQVPVLGSVDTLTDDDFVFNSVDVEKLDKDRLTRAALYFDLLSATADLKKPTSFRTIALYIDEVAESPEGYNDQRADTRRSRWLTSDNSIFAGGVVSRRLRSRSTAPVKLKLKLDPKDEPTLGSLVDISTRKVTGADGNQLTVRHRVVKVVDAGSHFDVETRSTSFGARYAFIAPNGYPDYALASNVQRERAFIAATGGGMSDGTDAYLII